MNCLFQKTYHHTIGKQDQSPVTILRLLIHYHHFIFLCWATLYHILVAFQIKIICDVAMLNSI